MQHLPKAEACPPPQPVWGRLRQPTGGKRGTRLAASCAQTPALAHRPSTDGLRPRHFSRNFFCLNDMGGEVLGGANVVLVAGTCPFPEALLGVAPSQSRLGWVLRAPAPSASERDARTGMGTPVQLVQGLECLWDRAEHLQRLRPVRGEDGEALNSALTNPSETDPVKMAATLIRGPGELSQPPGSSQLQAFLGLRERWGPGKPRGGRNGGPGVTPSALALTIQGAVDRSEAPGEYRRLDRRMKTGSLIPS